MVERTIPGNPRSLQDASLPTSLQDAPLSHGDATLSSEGDDAMTDTGLNQLSSQIIKAAMTVHSELGPGLLESVYNACMVMELKNMRIHVKNEVPLPVTYKGQVVSDNGLRLDLVVEDAIIVELKSIEQVQPLHLKQLLTYVRLAKKSLGLLINFNEVHLKDGIHRVVNSSRSD